MSLPTLAKTWQYNVNQAIAANAVIATQCAGLMYAIKASMVSIGTLPWTVWGSCDGAGNFGNNDAVDWWAAASDCVWNTGGNNHSWIVLKQAALGANFSICIDLNKASANAYDCSIIMSAFAGFSSNGTAIDRPTATDEIVLVNGKWGATTTANRAQKLHYMQSTDGQCSRVAIHSNSVNHGLWMFERLKNAATTGWTDPAVAMIAASSNGTAFTTVANLSTAVTPLFRARIDGSVAQLHMSTTSSNTTGAGSNLVTVQTFADEDTGEWPLFPVFIDSVIVPTRGRKGMLYDFWFGSSGLANGDQYPAAASRTFAQMGHVVVPWDGTAIAIV